jgi:hypothetical protein
MSKLSEGHALGVARAFNYWRYLRGEDNPRLATLKVYLEVNYPKETSVWTKSLHDEIDLIWSYV